MLQCQNMQMLHQHRQQFRHQFRQWQNQMRHCYFRQERQRHHLLRQISLSYFHPVRPSRLGRRHTKLL